MTDPTPPPPGWNAPRKHDPNLATIVVGSVFLAIGLWYFLDETLGFQMPDISWGSLWPVLLILIGGLILWRAASDRRR